MAKDMAKWHAAASVQQKAYSTVSVDRAASLETVLRGRRNTADVSLHCGNHETGWLVRIALIAGRVDLEFRRNTEDVPEDSLRWLHIAGLPGSGNVTVTCPVCEKQTTRTPVWLLSATIDALESPRTQNSRKYVRVS